MAECLLFQTGNLIPKGTLRWCDRDGTDSAEMARLLRDNGVPLEQTTHTIGLGGLPTFCLWTLCVRHFGPASVANADMKCVQQLPPVCWGHCVAWPRALCTFPIAHRH